MALDRIFIFSVKNELKQFIDSIILRKTMAQYFVIYSYSGSLDAENKTEKVIVIVNNE